jgi:hypothetical protein
VFTTSGTYPWSFVTQICHSGQPSHGGDRKTSRLVCCLISRLLICCLLSIFVVCCLLSIFVVCCLLSIFVACCLLSISYSLFVIYYFDC